MWRKDDQLIAILFILNGFFFPSESSSLVRNKRWDDTGDMSDAFRGTAGVDYPDLKSIPNTNFRCEEQIYEGGLYADVETNCQVYHVCHDGRKDSFMCGRGTIFNQQILACDYWYSTSCETAPSFYYVNSQIGNTYNQETSQYGQRQPNSEGATSLGRNNQQGEGNANFHNSYAGNNNVHLPNNDNSDILGASNPGDTWNGQGNYNRPESDNYNRQDTGSYNRQDTGSYNGQDTGSYNGQDTGSYNGQDTGSYNRPENGNYNQFKNGNENHSQNNQSPCKNWGNGSNKSPWSFPLRPMSD